MAIVENLVSQNTAYVGNGGEAAVITAAAFRDKIPR